MSREVSARTKVPASETPEFSMAVETPAVGLFPGPKPR